MEKIDFINNQQPALNATNLNKLQDNTEDAIQEVQDVADDLDTNKLDKTSVKDTYNTSTTDTYSCNYVNGLETYSTNETRVGTWIDGKPIYRKVITSTLTSTITHGIANINEIVNLKAVSYNPNSGKYFAVPSVRPSYSNYEVGLFADASTISLEYGSGLPTTMTFKIIMEYTKTTD